MHHFFVTKDNVNDEQIIIKGTDVNHIKNVLRMKPGEEMLVSDGEGSDFLCEVFSLNEDEVICNIIEKDFTGTESPAKFYLFQGLPKSDKMEMIIQKAVELGVYEIIPVSTKRSIVKLDDKKKAQRLKRYNAISESAAKQSRRSIIPFVKDVMNFEQALKYSADFDINIIPYENFKDMSETRKVMDMLQPGMKIGIFIGPEGGFDDKEVIKASESGVKKISLGKRILRTETAPLAILSILMFKMEE